MRVDAGRGRKLPDVEVTTTINIFVRDRGLVVSAGKSCGARLPLLTIAHERFRSAADAGFGFA